MRPSSFVGQRKIITDLTVHISSALRKNEPLEHVMFYGQAGLGKTTLANSVADLLGTGFIQRTGQDLHKEDLAEILTNIQYKDIFFIDEIHSTPTKTLELLYGPLQRINDYKALGKMPDLMSHEGIFIAPFTMIGATTTAGTIAKPLRDRIILAYRLSLYPIDDLVSLLVDRGCNKEAAIAIAGRSRGTPRFAVNYFIRARNESLKDVIPVSVCEDMFRRMGIDSAGFDATDMLIMEYLYNKQVASESELMKSLGIEKDDYHGIYETWLISQKMIAITGRGRVLTDRGKKYYEHSIR